MKFQNNSGIQNTTKTTTLKWNYYNWN